MSTRLDIYASRVFRKCEALRKASFWDREPRIQFRSWLANFQEDQKSLATQLLDKLIYFSDPMVDQMLITAAKHLPADLQSSRTFVVPVESDGETGPNPTDSGYLFCRKARQRLKVPEERCVTIGTISKLLAPNDTLVFLDDFVGTGNQMIGTLANLQSVADPAVLALTNIHYLGLVATESGAARLRNSGISCTFCHTIGPEYHIKELLEAEAKTRSGSAPASEVMQFLQQESQDLEVPSHVDKTWGFDCLALSIAFAHSVPDATIPLFWANSTKRHWTPLVERA